eukprot:snap_masked-scaffold_3-processed-gene-21.76-mRNA-1 protein AED:1.00 eAED:1.00 QI:0/0/0/0/1/1/2/0/81
MKLNIEAVPFPRTKNSHMWPFFRILFSVLLNNVLSTVSKPCVRRLYECKGLTTTLINSMEQFHKCFHKAKMFIFRLTTSRN